MERFVLLVWVRMFFVLFGREGVVSESGYLLWMSIIS